MATVLLVAHCAFAQANAAGAPAQRPTTKNTPVTAVTGESWLSHLNRSLSNTSMGKTGHIGPPAPVPGEVAVQWRPEPSTQVSPQAVTLHGADLYRMNCQGCHGESGQGAPPEINSVINPVRATSVTLVMERMKTAGMDISRADAVKLAQQSNAALLQRLHNGGQNMPPFSHLDEAEVRSLFAYLKQLAGLPGASNQQLAVNEAPARVGELIVKSTCHTCHSATGPDPEPQQIWDGAVPPLSVLTTRKSQPEFIRKVTSGTPILMGTPPMLYRGRMPVFYYLSEEEAADVYLYLTRYPPEEPASRDMTIALSTQDPAAGSIPPPPSNKAGTPFIPVDPPEGRGQNNDLQNAILLSGVGALVILLLAVGVGFTIREFQRLSPGKPGGSPAVKTKSQGRAEDVTATFQRVF